MFKTVAKIKNTKRNKYKPNSGVVLFVLLAFFILFGIYAWQTSVSNQKEQIKLTEDKSGGYTYQGKEHSFENIYFSGDSKGIPSVRMSDKGTEMVLTFIPSSTSNLSTLTTSKTDNTITYHNIEPNTNLIYTVENGSTVKEDIELIQRPDIEEGERPSYSFELVTMGLTHTVNPDGSVSPIFTSKDGTEYTIPPLYMIDAKGKRSEDVQMLITQKDTGSKDIFNITVTPSREWLMDEARVYPVRIDPTVSKGVQPVAYWSFDDGYGTTAQGKGSSERDGTFSGAPAWQQPDMCVAGKCLYFDGSDDYVSVGTDSTSPLRQSTGITYDTWFKIAPGSTGGYVGGVAASSGNGSGGFSVSTTAITFIWTATTPASDRNFSSTITLQTGKWYHVAAAVSLSGTPTAQIYLDGVPLTTTLNVVDVSNGTPTTSYNTANGDSIGSRYVNSRTYFKGFIDEVKIYDYARNAAQVKSNFLSRGGAYGTAAQFGGSEKVSGLQLTQGLAGYWKMDEASGTSATDSSGVGATGTLSTPDIVAGKFGNGLDFIPANDDYVSLGTNSAHNETAGFTYSAWLYHDSFTTETYPTLYNKGAQHVSIGYIWLYEQTGDGALYYQIANGSGVEAFTLSCGMTTATWQHVTVTHNRQTKKIQCYVNGELKDTDTYTSTASTVTAGSAHLGTYQGSASNSYHFDGKMDDVRIYNRSLSEAEVRALYNWAPGPVAYLNLDEGTSTTANDTTGNANTGTLTGSPTWTQGKYGKAVSMNGSTDYISMADSTTTSITRGLTVSAWVNPSTLTGTNMIISKMGTTTQNAYYLDSVSSGKLRFWLSSTGASAVDNYIDTDNVVLTANAWNHVEVAYDASAQSVSFYVNGVKVSATLQAGSIPSSIYDSNQTTLIGAYTNSSSVVASFFPGVIDDVKIYNYARTPGQIIEDMNGGHPAPGSPVASAIGHWKFDEGADNTCSGGSNDVCNSGSALTTGDGTSTASRTSAGKIGGALDYDGTDDYVSIPDASYLTPTSSGFSIAAWVNYDAFETAGSQVRAAIASKTPYSGSGSWAWTLGAANYAANTNPTFTFITTNTGGTTLSMAQDSTVVQTGQWYHVVGTVDSTGAARVYVNGLLKATGSGASFPSDTSEVLLIGAEYGAGNRWDTNGKIDEVKIYNLALNADQVKAEYNLGKAQVIGSKSTAVDGKTADWSQAREYCPPGDTTAGCNPPVYHYKFDENTGTTAYNVGTAGTTASWVGSGTPWAAGKSGQSAYFNGTDNYFTDTSASWTAGSAVTVSFWNYVKTTDLTGAHTAFNLGGNNDVNRFTAHVPYGDKQVSWDYGDINTNGRIQTDYTNYLDRWTYVTLVSSGSSNTYRAIYLDGVLVNSATTSNAPIANLSTLIVGTRDTRWHKGRIDDFKIYDYVRTPAQIAWEFNKGAPIAWWRFDECTGTDINDAAENGNGDSRGNDGVLTIGGSGTNTDATGGTCTTSGPWYDGTSGKINASMDFDGTDDYVTVADNALLDSSSTMSLSLWIKTASSWPSTEGIIGKRIGTSEYNQYAIAVSSSTLYWLQSSSGSGWETLVSTTTLPSASAWHHIVGTNDGTTARLYVDGVEYGTPDSSAATSLSASTAGLLIGEARVASADNYFAGQIDDVRIFNYALTPLQVKDVYNNGAVSFK